MQKTELKVKIKSLAEEARIIRKEENKTLKLHKMKYPEGGYCPQYDSLRNHRRIDVQGEARAALLAYGYLRGVPYKAMESKTKEDNRPNWKRVRTIAKKFGKSSYNEETFTAWAEA